MQRKINNKLIWRARIESKYNDSTTNEWSEFDTPTDVDLLDKKKPRKGRSGLNGR